MTDLTKVKFIALHIRRRVTVRRGRQLQRAEANVVEGLSVEPLTHSKLKMDSVDKLTLQ